MIGLEWGLFALNKHLGSKPILSATNTEVAMITVMGWWYTLVHAYADNIRAAQKQVVKLRPVGILGSVSSIDSGSRVAMAFFKSKMLNV